MQKIILTENQYRLLLKEDKYSNPEYRRLMNIFNVPVDIIWEYREFDRCGADNIKGKEYLESLTKDIEENGIKTPIKLQVDAGKALVIEGNHRLCIAKKLGFKTVPVQVDYGSFGSINKHKAKPINYNSTMWRVFYGD
jgi:hypothetical protein